eukprot:IDg19454t1
MLMAHSDLDPRQHRMAYVEGFGAFSAQVWLSCYTKSVFLYDFRRVQQEVLLNAHEIIRSHGARLATINTRDMRPGIDVDRYGPYGAKASFRSPSNEPKVGETPTPQTFKISDIPGAPFFSRMHVSDDAPFNIESGVSEESFVAAFRPDKKQQSDKNAAASPPTAPASNPAVETPVTSADNAREQQRSTSEAAVAAAAAALTAARRNAERIEEENAHRRRALSEATSASNTMKISAAPKASSSGPSSQSTESSDAGNSGTMKISAVTKPTSPPKDSDSAAGTMKISTAPKTTATTSSSQGSE